MQNELPRTWQRILLSPEEEAGDDFAQGQNYFESLIARIERELDKAASHAEEDYLVRELAATQKNLNEFKTASRDYLISKWGFTEDFLETLSPGQVDRLVHYLIWTDPDDQHNIQERIKQQIINELKSN